MKNYGLFLEFGVEYKTVFLGLEMFYTQSQYLIISGPDQKIFMCKLLHYYLICDLVDLSRTKQRPLFFYCLLLYFILLLHTCLNIHAYTWMSIYSSNWCVYVFLTSVCWKCVIGTAGRTKKFMNEYEWIQRWAAMVTGHLTPVFTNGDSLCVCVCVCEGGWVHVCMCARDRGMGVKEWVRGEVPCDSPVQNPANVV